MTDGRSVFAVARSIWTDSDFAAEAFTEREAWIWLVSSAAWKDIRARGNSGPINLKRGEFSFAVRFLAEKWLWTKSSVDRFIQRIEKRDMIRDTSRDGSKVYFITKYNHFQVVGIRKRDTEQDASRDDVGTAAGQQRDKEETGETVKQVKEESSLRSDSAPAPQTPSKPVLKSKPTRWDPEAAVPSAWISAAEQARFDDGSPSIDLAYEAKRFENYWAAKAGGGATKVDWRRTWLNWATDKEKTGNGKSNATKRPAIDQHLDGIADLAREIRRGNA